MIAADGIKMNAFRRPCQRHNPLFLQESMYSSSGLWLLPAVLDPCKSQRDCGSLSWHILIRLCCSRTSLHQAAPYGLTCEGLDIVCRVIDAELHQTCLLTPPLPVEPIGLRKSYISLPRAAQWGEDHDFRILLPGLVHFKICPM